MHPSLTSSLALIITLVMQTCFSSHAAHAEEAKTPPAQWTTECAPGVPVRLPLLSDYPRVKSENPAVLCVFRHTLGGFPTINIVEEPRHEGSAPPNLEEYREGITRGYRMVGLNDATLSNSVVGESNGLPFFSTEITFTNQNTPMVAKVLVVQYHDRTYTTSAIAEASPLETGRAAIAPLIDGIEVDGELVRDTRVTKSVLPLIGLGCAALVLVWVGLRSVRPRKGTA